MQFVQGRDKNMSEKETTNNQKMAGIAAMALVPGIAGQALAQEFTGKVKEEAASQETNQTSNDKTEIASKSGIKGVLKNAAVGCMMGAVADFALEGTEQETNNAGAINQLGNSGQKIEKYEEIKANVQNATSNHSH